MDCRVQTGQITSFRIISIFIVLVCSGVGVCSTLLAKYFLNVNMITFLKTIGTGVLLSCCFIHLLQPSNQTFNSGCVPGQFENFGYIYCMISFLLMQFLQNYLNFLARKREENCKKCISSIEPEMDIEAMGVVLQNKNIQETLLIEIVFNIHSIIIGITTGSASNIVPLIIALSFHQFFEGIALGARLFLTKHGVFSDFLFALLFTLSSPVGIGLGIAILHLNGPSFLMVQATLDGITSGVLLHISVSKILIDFPNDSLHRVNYLALCLGTGLMTFLGKYL